MSNEEVIRKIVIVLSGKGGVGKSTISTQLAVKLSNAGNKVGLLDLDLCGPSVPCILGLDDQEILQSPEGWVPVRLDISKNLLVMSIGFLLSSKDSSVIWRGPKKSNMINQLLKNTSWGNLDYLIIDTPPGTSDEHIVVVEEIKKLKIPTESLIITTPQVVALNDVRREISFCSKAGIKVCGLLENMSGFVCPSCKECTNIFSQHGGESLAKLCSIDFLGSLPILQSTNNSSNKKFSLPEEGSAYDLVLTYVLEKLNKS